MLDTFQTRYTQRRQDTHTYTGTHPQKTKPIFSFHGRSIWQHWKICSGLVIKQLLKQWAYAAWRDLRVLLSDVHFYRLIQIAMALKMVISIFLALLVVLVYAAAFMYCKSTHRLKHKTFCLFVCFPWDAMVFHVNWEKTWEFYKKKN